MKPGAEGPLGDDLTNAKGAMFDVPPTATLTHTGEHQVYLCLVLGNF